MDTPEVGDRVYDYTRVDDDLNPNGVVVYTMENEYVVRFEGGSYTRECSSCIRFNGILYPQIVLLHCPDMFLSGDDTKVYFDSELEKDGVGCWNT